MADCFLHERELTAVPDQVRDERPRVLDLATNPIDALPDWLGELDSVEILYAHHLRLTAIPPSLARHRRLVYLNLAHNQLRALPALDLPALLELRLGGNTVYPLPPMQLPRLRELYLRGNQLRAIPDALGDLADLHILELRDNQLTALPDTLGRLHKLLYLDLRGNQLATLPDALGDLPELRKLDLRWNPIAGRPACIDRLLARGCAVYL
jgi:Leucine-rich repeat (LRR) protein